MCGDLLIVRLDNFRAQRGRSPNIRAQKSFRARRTAFDLKRRFVADKSQQTPARRWNHLDLFAAHNFRRRLLQRGVNAMHVIVLVDRA